MDCGRDLTGSLFAAGGLEGACHRHPFPTAVAPAHETACACLAAGTRGKAVQWFTAIVTLVLAGNIFVGGVGYLHAIMIVLFLGPASIFATAVREIFDDAYREAKDSRT